MCLLAEVGFVTSAEFSESHRTLWNNCFQRLGRFACKNGGFASVGKTFQHPRASPIGNGDKVCVGGGAGFIGSHIAKRLKEAGYKVTAVDWKENEFMEKDEFCDEFILDDAQTRGCLQGMQGLRPGLQPRS